MLCGTATESPARYFSNLIWEDQEYRQQKPYPLHYAAGESSLVAQGASPAAYRDSFQKAMRGGFPTPPLPAVEQLKAAHKGAIERKELPGTATLGQLALRWILDTEGATCVIPGARTIEQVEGNLGACGLPKVSEVVNKQVKEVYDSRVKAVIEKEKW